MWIWGRFKCFSGHEIRLLWNHEVFSDRDREQEDDLLVILLVAAAGGIWSSGRVEAAVGLKFKLGLLGFSWCWEWNGINELSFRECMGCVCEAHIQLVAAVQVMMNCCRKSAGCSWWLVIVLQKWVGADGVMALGDYEVTKMKNLQVVMLVSVGRSWNMWCSQWSRECYRCGSTEEELKLQAAAAGHGL